MKLPKVLLWLALAAIIAGCRSTPGQQPSFTASSSSAAATASSLSSSEDSILTKNVNYTGVVQSESANPLGTHRLMLQNGKSILLQSTDANLNLDTYIGKKVEVRGTLRSSPQPENALMHVDQVTVLEPEASVGSQNFSMCGGIAGLRCPAGWTCVDDPRDQCDPKAGGADCSGICIEDVFHTESQGSSAPTISSAKSSGSSSKKSASSVHSLPSSPSSKSSGSASSFSSESASTSVSEAQITLMARQNYGDGNWTKKYCTGHIGFCVPVHRNWYYKSFGATTTSLWHVEFGMSAIEELHSGPITLKVFSGPSTEGSGQVIVDGNQVVASQDWDGGRHIEIYADVRLRAAVEYMINHLEKYTSQ